MPAKSIRQQHFFGAIKGGAIPRPKGMSSKTVNDFASTSTAGLQEKATPYMADGWQGKEKSHNAADWMDRVKPAPHMADGGDGHWMEKAFAHNKGGLHKALHVPADKTIPAYRVKKAAASNNGHLARMAQAAENANPRHRKNYGS